MSCGVVNEKLGKRVLWGAIWAEKQREMLELWRQGFKTKVEKRRKERGGGDE